MYGKVFSAVYNSRWTSFAKRVAPLIIDFYERSGQAVQNRHILDLCCGTGQFSVYALQRGYSVLGIDASPHMLTHAVQNARSYVDAGKASFVVGRAEDFSVGSAFGLVVSLFDSLNHLDNMHDLKRCFECVFRATARGGYFIFDLNTIAGLRRWNTISVTDEEDLMIVNRGFYTEGAQKAYVKISGFLRMENGSYERFEEDMFNTAFELEAVRQALVNTGWDSVYMAKVDDLATPLLDPEKEGRVFFVARRQ